VVTRYLCAGAYLDPDFAQSVVDELATDPSRGVAPAPGVDVPAVVRHSLAALRRALQRDAALTLVLLFAAVATGLRGVLIVAWFSALVLLAWAARNLFRGEAGKAAAQALAFGLLSVVFLVALIVIHEQSRREFAQPVGWSGWLPFDLTTVGLVVALLWIVTFLARIAHFASLAERLAADRFDAGDAPREAGFERDRLAYLADAQSSTLAVYSVRAPGAPFVGLGPVVHAWSAATGLFPRSGTAAPERIAVIELYRELRPAMHALAAEWGRGYVVDLVVVPGQLPGGHPFLTGVPAHPLAQMPAAVVDEIAARPGPNETYYQAVVLDTDDGRGGLVGLIHLRTEADRLAVDVAVTALPPLDPRFATVDAMPVAGPGVLVRTLGAALADVFRLSYRAPGNLVRSVSRAFTHRASLTANRRNPAARADFGARRGLRELGGAGDEAAGSGAGYETGRGVNRFGRAVVDGIATVLTARGLDAEEFTRSAEQVRQMSMAAGMPAPAATRTGGAPGRERS
jgi:hypothetical protein